MGKYVRILEEVTAVRAKSDNLEEIKSLAGKAQRVHDQCGTFYDVGLLSVVWKGDWLVKHEDGKLGVMTDESFRSMYEPK